MELHHPPALDMYLSSVIKVRSYSFTSPKYPMAWAYLNRNRKLLEGREKGKFKDTQWYCFGRTQNLGLWE